MKALKKLLLIFTISTTLGVLLFLLNSYSTLDSNQNVSSQIVDFTANFDDEIPPDCPTLREKNFSDRSNFDIKLTIPDSRSWYLNLINGELGNNGIIFENVKKQQAAILTVINKETKKSCSLDALVRISGDVADHINLNNFTASLDVELLRDNFFGYTDFKLFLPETRNKDNEIFVTSLISALGYLAPTTFYIDIEVNGEQVKYLFQEKINKIFIESNNLKEGPILEANESLAWSSKGFSMKTILPPRIVNKTWLKKSNDNIELAKFALQKLHKVRIFGLDTVALNFGILDKQNSDYLKEYTLLLNILQANAGMPYDDRKFYFEAHSEFLYPIYYDGSPRFFNEKTYPKLTLRKNQTREVILNLKQHNIMSVNEKIKSLDYLYLEKDLVQKGILLDKIDFTYDELSKYLFDSINDFDSDLQKNTHTESNSVQQFNSYFFDNSDNREKYLFLIEENDEIKICEPDLLKCKKQKFDNDEILEILSGRFYIQEKLVFYLGSMKNLQNFYDSRYLNYKTINNLGLKYDIKFLGDADFVYGNKTLTIENPSSDFRLLIQSQELIDEKIIFKSNNNNDQYNKSLLTGCVNIIDSKLTNFSFDSFNASCEDSINIVSSKGVIDVATISNSSHDGLDIDFSNIKINQLFISNSKNDCSDFSYGNYAISESRFKNCNDKAISVGEKSDLKLNSVYVTKSFIGIAIKDSSKVKIDYLDIENTEYCLASYRKKQEFNSPIVVINNDICSSSKVYNQLSQTNMKTVSDEK